MKKFIFILLFMIVSGRASAQYCNPLYYFNNITSGAMNHFSVTGFAGSSIDDLLPLSSLAIDYINRTTTVGQVDLQQGHSYNGTIYYYTGQDHTGNQIWIDFNNDNFFADSEKVTGVFPSAFSFFSSFSAPTFTLYIPPNAPTGFHRMRVRNVSYYLAYSPGFGSPALSSCNISDTVNQYFSGVTADYIANIAALPSCTGPSIPGHATGPATICNGVSFDLSLVNDTVTAGLLYQWFSKPVGSGSMSPISGATSRVYHNPGQSGSTQYQATVRCPSATVADSSTMFTVNSNPFYLCYCHEYMGGNPVDCTLDSVSILGTTLNTYILHNANLYTAFPDTGSARASLQQGVTYNLFVGSGGNRTYNAYMWIDYNRNGVFDASEYTVVATHIASGGNAHISFTVPLTADTGITMMRIRTIHDSIAIASGGSCSYETSGEAEDFNIHIGPVVHCSGTPLAGDAYSSMPAACPGRPFYLSAAGYSFSTDMTFQWVSRPTGTTVFTPIAGATGSLYTIASQTTGTEYALIVRCPISGLSDTSTIVAVGENPFYLCYCAPPTTILNDFAYQAPIDSVYIVGTTLNNPTPSSAALYTSYFPSTPSTTANLEQGFYYNIAVNSNGTGNYNAGMWIDYNQNGTFDDVEYVSIAANVPAGVTSTAAFSVPSSTPTGTIGLRIRTSRFSEIMGASDACAEEFDGATADYVINIVSGVSCVGTPVAGIVNSSSLSVCPGQPFTLTDVGASSASGITYQWYSRPASAGTFSPIFGATSLIYTVASQSENTDYKMVVTCTASGMADTSFAFLVTENSFFLCYCSPLVGYTLDDSAYAAPIDSVSIGGTGLNDYTPGSTDVYIQYSLGSFSTSADLVRGSNYVIAVNSAGTSSYLADMWIDYNRDGSFDASEFIPVAATSTLPGHASYGLFTIPVGADTGYTGMRVRTISSLYSMGSADACTEENYGATRDYVVNITHEVACSGTPIAGSASAIVSEVCVNEPFMISADGYSNSSGITYQWIRANTGSGIFSNISGATNPIYTVPSQSVASDYALVVRCTASGLKDTSTLATIFMKAFYRCYCSPLTGSSLSSFSYVAPIDSVSVTGTTLNNSSFGSTDIYAFYFPVTATTTTTLQRGNAYTIKLNSTGTDNYNSDAWIDFNHNGTFDASEYIAISANINPGTVSTVSFVVPNTADTGLTGLRIRSAEYIYGMTATDACSAEYYGATQDYVITIGPGTPCTGTPNASTAITPVTTICPSTSFTITDTGYTAGAGINYQWYSRPAGSGGFTIIAGATNPSYTITSQTAATDYRFTTTCTSSSLSNNSNIITVAETPYSTCYCGSSLGSFAYPTAIANVAISGSTLHVGGGYSAVHKVFGMVGDSTGTLQRSLPYTLNLQVAGGTAFNAGMWIDYNHSGTFETSEYILLDTNVATGTTSSTTFTIPAIADTGVTGMRIRATPSYNAFGSADACTDIYYSQTFDFRIKIDTLVTCSGMPDAGTITSPTLFACPVSTFTLANSGYTVGSGISYQWLKRNAGSGAYATITGATTHAYTVTGQTVGTDYILVARCSFSGLRDTSNVLTVGENPFDSCYCSPPLGTTLVSAGGHEDILITSIVGTTMYSYGTTPDSTGYLSIPPTTAANTASMQRGTSYPISVFVNYTAHTITSAGMWIDYDHNSIFSASEFISLTQSTDHSYWSSNIAIPTAALLGLTGMRVVTAESGTVTAASACTPLASGEVEDFIVTLTLPPCYSISAASVINITDTSARGVWGHLAGAAGYQYVIDNSSGTPSGSGIATTDTFVNTGCLTSNTTYYLHVRDSCGAGYFSSWITVPFTTLPCPGTITINATGITDHSATITWDSVLRSSGYEYVVNTTAADPSGSGTFAADSTVTVAGLTQGTVYYAHVRSRCPCANRSAWQTISFTTVCDSITHLTVFNLTDTSAGIRWDSIHGVTSYGYVVNTTPGPPSGGGLTTPDSSVVVTGLTPGTLYYVHVRHNCTGGYSSWVTIPFVTPHCDTVTGLTATPTDTSVVFSWTAVSGALGYYYVINTTPGAPGTSGTYITTAGSTVNGLLSGVTYYLHVRTGCGGGLSSWETISFHTSICDTVTGLAVSAICDTSAHISWTAASSGGGGYVYVLNNTAGIPTIPGILTTSTFVNFTTLTPGTSYYFHIRHKCSALDSSAWVTVHFVTLPCDTVSGVTITGISDTGATISWTGSTCIAGYIYVVNSSSATPSGGTFMTTTTATETTLTPGTTYYAHIRVHCGGGDSTAWVNVPFTTLPCDTTTVTITAIMDNSANVGWTIVPGTAGYEYAVDNTATPPASGTATTTTSYAASGLTQLTLYYAHVRVICGGGQFSSWVNVPFTTTNVGVPYVNGSSFDLQAFPNPANAMLTVVVKGGDENRNLFVTDLTGKVLIRAEMVGDTVEIDLSKLASGVYIVKYTDDSHVKTMKLNKL